MKFSFFKSLYQPLPLEDEEPEEVVQIREPEVPVVKPVRPGVDMSALSEDEYSGLLSNDVLPMEFLDKIIELINSGLPDFVRSCIDLEAEKKQIYAQLREPLTSYLKKVIVQVKSDGAASLQLQQTKLTEVTECLNKRIRDAEQQRDEIQKSQLSTERQKRTLTERAHELENRVATLETEKEKIDETRRQVNEQLRKANIRLEQLTAEAESWSGLQAQLNESNDRVAVLSQAEQQYNTKLAELSKELESGADRSVRLQEALEQKEQEIAVSALRIVDLEMELTRAADAERKAMKSIDEQLTQSAALIKVKADREAELLSVLSEKEMEAVTLTGRLKELEQQFASVSDRQIGKENALNEEIATLKAELATMHEKEAQVSAESRVRREQIDRVNEESGQLLQRLSAYQKAEQETKHRLSELEHALIEASQENEELEQSVRSLEKQLTDRPETRPDHSDLADDNQLLTAQVGQLQSLLSDMQQALETRSKECETLDRELAVFRQKYQAVQAGDTEKINEMESERVRLKHDLQVANDMYQAMKTQRADLLADNETLHREKELLRKKLDRQTDETHQIQRQKRVSDAEVKHLKKASVSSPKVPDDGLAVEDDVLDWLVPTRLETPEEREARFEAEKQLQKEQEQREKELREKERERLKNDAAGQMSLW